MRLRTSNDVLSTYRYLRLAMILLVLLLGASVLWQTFSTDPFCLQRSISAYYFTAARAVFVAGLCAIGACLVVYRGNSDTEDVLLNFSGFLAFVVAFVPTEVDTSCKAANVPTAEELSAAVRNNVSVLLLLGGVTVALAVYLDRHSGAAGRGSRATGRAGSRASGLASLAALAALVAGAVFFVGWPDTFVRNGHNVAAVALFIGILGVVGVNAWGFARRPGDNRGQANRDYANRYAAVAGVMVISAVAIVAAGRLVDSFTQWVFWLEAALIVEFAVFWAIQTHELWDQPTRGAGRTSTGGTDQSVGTWS